MLHDSSKEKPTESGSSDAPEKRFPNPESSSGEKEVASSTGLPSQQARKVTGIRWVVMVTSVLSSVFLYSLDNTIVADIQPDIIKSLGEIQKLPWLSIAFLVACVATNSIWGKIYTQFNAKWLYMLCILIFEVGSALCGAAPTMNAMIGGRVLPGVGGAGLYIGVMTVGYQYHGAREANMHWYDWSCVGNWNCVRTYKFSWQTTSRTFLDSCDILTFATKKIVGGAFAVSKVGWRWAFYLNLFVAAVAAPAYLLVIPSHDPQPGMPFTKRWSKLDYLGTILMLGASVTGVLAINSGGTIYSWDDGRIITYFVVSGVLLIAFGIQQSYCLFTTDDNRTFPCHFLTSKIHIILFLQAAAASSLFLLPIYFVPLYFQFIRDDSAIQAGVRLLPLVYPLVFAVIMNGALMSKYGYYTTWYLAGGAFALAGSTLLYHVKVDTSSANIYGYLVLLGIGGGMYAQAKSKPHEIPWAVGFIALGQLSGATIALAIGNSLFLNKALAGILAVAPSAPKSEILGALSGAGSALFRTFDQTTRKAALEAISSGISMTYVLAMTGAALTISLVSLMSFEKLFIPTGAAI